MSIQTEITRIESAKTAIATAIEGKGVTVPTGTKLDGLAALVESIEAGGGGLKLELGHYIPSEDTKLSLNFEIQHNAGFTPFFIFAYNMYPSTKNELYMFMQTTEERFMGGYTASNLARCAEWMTSPTIYPTSATPTDTSFYIRGSTSNSKLVAGHRYDYMLIGGELL